MTLASFMGSTIAALANTTTQEQARKNTWQQLSLALTVIPGFTPTSNQINSYIELIGFDKNWKYIGSQRRIVSKSSLNNCGELLEISYQMPEDGYVQAITVNESATESVWFDDIELTQEENLITQENHYDAFGLALSGIEKQGNPENDWKFNSIEKVEDLGLNWDMAFYRSMDAQLGRWNQIDPKTESFYALTPYNSMGNNPLRFNDPLGDYFDGEESQQEAKAALGKALDRIVTLSQQREKLQGQLDAAKKSGDKQKIKSLERQMKNNMASSGEMHRAIAEIITMAQSDQAFIIKKYKADEMPGGYNGGTTYWKDKKAVVMTYKEGNTYTLFHELKHGYDFLQGELSYKNLQNLDMNNPTDFYTKMEKQIGSMYDYEDEVRAYKRGLAFDPTQGAVNGAYVSELNANNPTIKRLYSVYEQQGKISTKPKNTQNTPTPSNEVTYKAQ